MELVSKKIGIGFQKNLYRKKYWNWFQKKLSLLVSEKNGIEKSFGFGIEKKWYWKKISDSFSFIFWVSSHTDGQWAGRWTGGYGCENSNY